jgi:hypothetical protein
MKLLSKSVYLCIFYLTVNSAVTTVLAESNSIHKTQQISQKFQPQVDNQANPKTIGAATRFRPPVDDDRNPPTVGAGTRGSSCLKQQVITPLLPTSQSGLTLKEHPTFFWHIPPSSVKTAEFIVLTKDKDGEENIVYQTNLTLPNKPGIVGFTLPNNAPALAINTTYRWYLTLICDPEDSSNNPYVEGLVKRIPAKLPIAVSLQKPNSLPMATMYAQNGIWQDALTSLVKLRCSQPNNSIIKSHWMQFLDSVGLNKIASAPLVNSCINK